MMTPSMNTYWNSRYADGRIWGDNATPSVKMASDWFWKYQVNEVLVPGCGYGRNSMWLAKQGFQVTAFDVSDVAIQLATELAFQQGINVNYLVEDLFEPALFNGMQFDGIYLSNVLHLFLAGDRQRLMDRMDAMLKPGGMLALTCISIYDQNNYGIGREVEANTFEKHEGKPLHFYSEDELLQLFEENDELLTHMLHMQTESDPSGEFEDLQLWFAVGKKR